MACDDTIYHLVESGPWIIGVVYTPASLGSEGFIHLSSRDQLLDTVERFFGHTRGLLVIEVSTTQLHAELRYEEVHGSFFPHLYGPLNPSAVVAVHAMARGADGSYVLPTALSSQ